MEHITMIKTLTLMAGLSMLATNVIAEPSSAVAFDVPTLKMLRDADPARGETVAGDNKCAKCHGDAGVSDDPDDINIAGMSRSYIYKQLVDYKDKSRDNRDMYKRVKKLENQDFADMAAWYESLEPAAPRADRQMTPELRQLIVNGDPTRLLKGCAACHGRDGMGGQFDHPLLTGQHKQYLIDSMTEFKDEDRENDVYGRMRDVSRALTEAEIEMLADYYAAFVPEEEE